MNRGSGAFIDGANNILAAYFDCSIGPWKLVDDAFSRGAAEVFDHLVRELRSISALPGLDPPKLVSISSMAANIELIDLDGATYIILDSRYFYNTTVLNILLLAEAPLAEIDTMLTRLWACRHYAQGRLPEALKFASVYRWAKPYERSDLNGREHLLEVGAALQSVELAYLLAHELTHFCWGRDEVFRRVASDLYCRALDAHKNHYSWEYSEMTPNLAEALTKSAMSNWGVGESDASAYSELYESHKDRILRRYVTDFPLTWDAARVRSDDDLFEELICDAIGCFLAARVLKKNYRWLETRTIGYCSVAMQHLNLLKQMDATRGEEAGVVQHAQVRMLFLRRYLLGASIEFPDGDPLETPGLERHLALDHHLHLASSFCSPIDERMAYDALFMKIHQAAAGLGIDENDFRGIGTNQLIASFHDVIDA